VVGHPNKSFKNGRAHLLSMEPPSIAQRGRVLFLRVVDHPLIEVLFFFPKKKNTRILEKNMLGLFYF
jgi:hypothetical protein